MPKRSESIDTTYGGYEAVKAIVGHEPPRHPKNLQRWIDRGFPPAVMLGTKTKVWNLAQVREYMARLEAEANAQKKGGR